MYWRMYAGHNCTNYVAYRLIQTGMPDSRPVGRQRQRLELGRSDGVESPTRLPTVGVCRLVQGRT